MEVYQQIQNLIEVTEEIFDHFMEEQNFVTSDSPFTTHQKIYYDEHTGEVLGATETSSWGAPDQYFIKDIPEYRNVSALNLITKFINKKQKP